MPNTNHRRKTMGFGALGLRTRCVGRSRRRRRRKNWSRMGRRRRRTRAPGHTNTRTRKNVVRRANKPSEARLVSEAPSERMRREGRTRRTTLDCFGECLHQLLNGPLFIPCPVAMSWQGRILSTNRITSEEWRLDYYVPASSTGQLNGSDSMGTEYPKPAEGRLCSIPTTFTYRRA